MKAFRGTQCFFCPIQIIVFSLMSQTSRFESLDCSKKGCILGSSKNFYATRNMCRVQFYGCKSKITQKHKLKIYQTPFRILISFYNSPLCVPNDSNQRNWNTGFTSTQAYHNIQILKQR